MRAAWLASICLWGVLLAPGPAEARRDTEVRYRYDQVWGSVVRLVRVDYQLPIRDRDEEVGYLLFDYKDSGREHPGSFELVRTKAGGQERVRVVLSIPAMPSYVERMILDKLLKKLEQDYGAPPPERPTKPPPKDEPDKDTEAKPEDE
jgi:hypothetical protein